MALHVFSHLRPTARHTDNLTLHYHLNLRLANKSTGLLSTVIHHNKQSQQQRKHTQQTQLGLTVSERL